jgi:hypothetical protein
VIADPITVGSAPHPCAAKEKIGDAHVHHRFEIGDAASHIGNFLAG